jgi:3-hydroxybutyryl-CoA dehydratase
MSFTENHLFFDDIAVGQEWRSLGRTVTQADIVNFAGISGDFNPIHMDHEFAKTTPFQQPIAHGLLIFSIASGLGLHNPAMRTLAFMSIRDWQFKDPVYVGDTIYVNTKVLQIEPGARGRRGVVTWQKQLVKQTGRVVQEGIVVSMVEGRASKRRNSSEAAQSAPAS